MVIHNFHLSGITLMPDKANPPLVIYTNPVLTGAAAFECFQPITRWCQQILQTPGPVQVFQLAPRRVLNVWRQFAGTFTVKDPFRFAARKGGDHRTTISRSGNMSRRRLTSSDYHNFLFGRPIPARTMSCFDAMGEETEGEKISRALPPRARRYSDERAIWIRRGIEASLVTATG